MKAALISCWCAVDSVDLAGEALVFPDTSSRLCPVLIVAVCAVSKDLSTVCSGPVSLNVLLW